MSIASDHRSPSVLGPVTRRRSLTLLAGASAALLGGRESMAAVRAGSQSLYRWRGTALGAAANLAIYHHDAREARRLVSMARAEIERLEQVFSLYRPDSALVHLNQQGKLDAPPTDLVILLAQAQLWAARTGGAFDPTVQPLWRLYAEHFASPAADPLGPSSASIDAARRLVDYRSVAVAPSLIKLTRPGMAITLNGIAQGYVTDRVADLLRGEGLQHVLIDLGEIRALGRRADGRPWRVGLDDPSSDGRLSTAIEIDDRAVASSATTGTLFNSTGRMHHLFDPKSGRPSQGLLAATVVARRATDADALSTALLADAGLLSAPQRFAGTTVEKILTTDRNESLRSWEF